MATGSGGKKISGKKTAVHQNGRPSFSHTASPERYGGQPSQRSVSSARRSERPREDGRRNSTAAHTAESSAPRAAVSVKEHTQTVSPAKTRRKARAQKRRARIYICIAAVLVTLSVLLAVTVFFTVDVIEVNGNTVYTSDEIIDKTGIRFGDNLLLMDKFQAIDRIQESLFFIDSVEIRRSLPNKLIINVTEVVLAVAFDCGDGNFWLADTDGRLLEKVTEVPSYSARVTGIELKNPLPGKVFTALESEKQQPLETLLAALEANDSFQYVSDIRIEKIYDIRMTYKDRYEVIFGRSDTIDNAVAKLDYLVAELESQGTYSAEIDFSDGSIRVVS